MFFKKKNKKPTNNVAPEMCATSQNTPKTRELTPAQAEFQAIALRAKKIAAEIDAARASFEKRFNETFKVITVPNRPEDDDYNLLSTAKTIEYTMEIKGYLQYRARNLQNVMGDFIIKDKAILLADELKNVDGRMFVRNTSRLILPELKSTKCIYVDNVDYIVLPQLRNCRLYINHSHLPLEITVDPSVQVFYGDYPLSNELINRAMESRSQVKRAELSLDSRSQAQKTINAAKTIFNGMLENGGR